MPLVPAAGRSANRPWPVAATASGRMGGAVGDETLSETGRSFAARAPFAQCDHHAQAPPLDAAHSERPASDGRKPQARSMRALHIA